MTKSNYLSSAAKYFAIVSALILLPNLFSMLGSSDQVAELAVKITSFSFYLIIALTYIALNGEGIAYRKNNMIEKLKSVVALKRYLLFSVIINFAKNYLERKVVGFSGNNGIKLLLQFSTSVLFSVTSFSFVVAVVLIWYLKRDKVISKLFKVEIVAIACGVLYNLFKVFNYTVETYGLKIYGETLTTIFESKMISGCLCVGCCIVFIVVFIVISKYYNTLSLKEEEERKNLLALRKTTVDICKEDGYGIDFVEDDFILNSENS